MKVTERNLYLLLPDSKVLVGEVLLNNADDGERFINIWIHGKTELGQMLSHFYKSQFMHPYYGPFNSMEGFWFFIQNGAQDDHIRSLSGMAAKNYGKKLAWQRVDNFQEIIMAANYYKIEQNPVLRKLFVESSLPFEHYYMFTPTGDAIGQPDQLIRLVSNAWLIKGFEELRTKFQFGQRPAQIEYKAKV